MLAVLLFFHTFNALSFHISTKLFDKSEYKSCVTVLESLKNYFGLKNQKF